MVRGGQDGGRSAEADSTHWQTLDRRLVADRSPFAKVYDEDVRLPDGTVITNWMRVELPPFIIVFAVMTDGRVPLVRQYRQAVRDWTLELPAGHLEPDEEPVVAAQRELHEEAGLAAAEWHYLGKYIMDANRDCGWCNVYLATGAQQVAAPDAGDVGEMTVQYMTLEDVRQRWRAGEFVGAPTALAIGLALARLGT